MNQLVFFSFVQLGDPSEHRNYNEWHQLDHRPENLALPGISWGDRWARDAECKQLSHTSERFADVDYTAMYWFNSPTRDGVDDFDRLGEQTFQAGRDPLFPAITRPLRAFFRPVKGYASPQALVSPDVLPYRPNRGIHITVTEYDNPHSLAVHEQHTWEDRSRIPDVLRVDGVAGAWTFSLQEYQTHSYLKFEDQPEGSHGSLRVRLVYLDGYRDALETATALTNREAELDADGHAAPTRNLGAPCSPPPRAPAFRGRTGNRCRHRSGHPLKSAHRLM